MRTFLTVTAAVGLLALAVPTQAAAQTTTPSAKAAKATSAAVAKNKRRHVNRAKNKVLAATHRDRHYHAYGYRARTQARHYSEWRFSPSTVGYQGR